MTTPTISYNGFIESELRDELTDVQYEPALGIVYAKVDNGFKYRSEYYTAGMQIALDLDTGIMRVIYAE